MSFYNKIYEHIIKLITNSCSWNPKHSKFINTIQNRQNFHQNNHIFEILSVQHVWQLDMFALFCIFICCILKNNTINSICITFSINKNSKFINNIQNRQNFHQNNQIFEKSDNVIYNVINNVIYNVINNLIYNVIYNVILEGTTIT